MMPISAGSLLVDCLRASYRPLVLDRRLTIQRIARERWYAGTGIRPAVARTCIWTVVLRGSMFLHHDGREERVGVGELAAIPEGASYQLWLSEDEDCEHVIMNATGDHCTRWWRFLNRETPAVLITRRRREIEQVIDLMLQHLEASDHNDRWSAGHYFQAMLSVIAVDQQHAAGLTSSAARYAETARDAIDRDPTALAGMDTLAEEVGVSRDYLTRCFRSHFQESPGLYLRRRKMDHACELLLTGNQTMADIAEILGYSDAFAFSKAFKQHTGLSPRDWTRQFVA